MEGSHGLRWTLFGNLEDLYFDDDIVLLSHRHSDSQVKTSRMTSAAKSIDLNRLLVVGINSQDFSFLNIYFQTN